jgi:hypothetical protein
MIDGLWVRLADPVKALTGSVIVDEESGKLVLRVGDD